MAGALRFPGEQRLQKVLHLRQHHQGIPDAQLTGQLQLPPEGPGVVKKDEVGLPLPGQGEIPGAQGVGIEGGAACGQGLQLGKGQGRALTSGADRKSVV